VPCGAVRQTCEAHLRRDQGAGRLSGEKKAESAGARAARDRILLGRELLERAGSLCCGALVSRIEVEERGRFGWRLVLERGCRIPHPHWRFGQL